MGSHQVISYNKNNNLAKVFALLLVFASVQFLTACGSSGGGAAAVVPALTLSAASVYEGNTGTANLDFTVTLSAATSVDVTVDYASSDDTATAGVDYTATSGTLTIPANNTSATISVPVSGDIAVEDSETFNLQISNASSATIANSSQTVQGTIDSDDLAGYYTGSATVNEMAGSLVINDPDIQVIFDSNQLVIINLANNLTYVAPITSFVDNTFTSTARIYKDGDFTTTTTISATFIAGDSVALALSGTGDYTTGNISLAYSVKNGVVPLVLTGAGWQDMPTSAAIAINTITNIDIFTTANVPSTVIESCDAVSVDLIDVISEQTGRLRSFAALTDNNCPGTTFDGTILNGYITTFDNTLADDRILFVWFNDAGVHTASLIKL